MKIVKLYLMEKDNDKNSLEALNARYIKDFCRMFKGCTVYKADGYWVSDDGVLFQDKTLVCEIFIDTKKSFDDDTKAMVSFFRGVAKHYKQEARQECVSLVVDGQALIIKQQKKAL